MFQRLPLTTDLHDLANRPDIGTVEDVVRFLLERVAVLEDRVASLERDQAEHDGAEAAAEIRLTPSPPRSPSPPDATDPTLDALASHYRADLVPLYRQYLEDAVGPGLNPGRLARRLAATIDDERPKVPARRALHIPTLKDVAAQMVADAIVDPMGNPMPLDPLPGAQWARDQADRLHDPKTPAKLSTRGALEFGIWVGAAEILERQ